MGVRSERRAGRIADTQPLLEVPDNGLLASPAQHSVSQVAGLAHHGFDGVKDCAAVIVVDGGAAQLLGGMYR